MSPDAERMDGNVAPKRQPKLGFPTQAVNKGPGMQ